MSQKTVTAVFTTEQVMGVLARHLIEQRGLEVAEDTNLVGELMAIAGRDASGQPGIEQYRIQFQFEPAKESWRG